MRLFLVILGTFTAVFAISIGMIGLLIINKEIRLRNEAAAQETANQAIFDSMWKNVSQVSNVNDDYKEDFRKSWKDILSAQSFSDRLKLFNLSINRVNPKFDSALSKHLMIVIERYRKDFLKNQKQLIIIKRDHDNLRTTWPGKLFVGNVPELQITIVTSSYSDKVFESKKEDNTSLRK